MNSKCLHCRDAMRHRRAGLIICRLFKAQSIYEDSGCQIIGGFGKDDLFFILDGNEENADGFLQCRTSKRLTAG